MASLMTSIVTAPNLLTFAGKLEGESWVTLARKRPFHFRVTSDGIQITPLSGKSRRLSRADLEKFCDDFNRRESFARKDYPENWHTSYLLSLIKRFLQSNVEHAEK